MFSFVNFDLGGLSYLEWYSGSQLFTIGSTLIKHTPIDWKLNFLKGNIKTEKNNNIVLFLKFSLKKWSLSFFVEYINI